MEMKAIKIDHNIKNKLQAPIPDYLVQQRQGGGGKMLSYLSGSTITDMLNDAFGYAWSYEIKEQWVQESVPSFNTFSKSKEKVNYNGKDGAWEDQLPVAHVKITLIVYMQIENGNIVEIRKDGYGSKAILGKQNDQESIYKAAGTDALKKAASLFGIGLELYRNESEQAYFDIINYEDPWTDELTAEFEEQLAYIESYKADNGVSDEAWDEFVGQVTGETYLVTPDNITGIVNYIAEAIGEE